MLLTLVAIGLVVLVQQVTLILLTTRVKRCEDALANTRAVLESNWGAALARPPAPQDESGGTT